MRKWRRLREAAAVASMPALTRPGTSGDGDEDDQPCPTCQGTGVNDGAICSTCNGSGSVMRESRVEGDFRWTALHENTRGSYWVYTDDPDFEQLREATRTFSSDVRKKYASSGVSLPDGSYPIPDKDALGRAIKAIGRASDPAKAKAHIIKRARALGATDQLPDDWQSSKEAGGDNFGGKKALPFGKKDKKGGGKDDTDDEDDDTKEGKSDSKTREAALEARVEGLEADIGPLRRLREAKPAHMTPTFSTPVRVKTSDGREGYQVVLIREGKGNNEDDQWYTAAAVKELCESGVAEGMQAFANHPDLEEEENRPERDVKELIGSYCDVQFKESGGPPRAEAILVPMTLDPNHPRYGWVVTLAEAAIRSRAPQPLCGISLYGLSAGDDGTRPDGSHGRMVELIRPASGDVVTNAGAGGGFVRQLMESARALRNHKSKELSPMQSLEYQNRVREAVKRVREAASDEDRDKALEELGSLETERIDDAPNSLAQLREAAPTLVQELVDTTKAETQAEGEQTIEELRESLRKANENNEKLSHAVSSFTEVIGVTDALREAGVTDAVEIRHYAGMAKRQGLREAADIKDMVETDREMEKRRQAQLRESLMPDDDEVEGVVARLPGRVTLPSDGGVDKLRESGIPTLTSA